MGVDPHKRSNTVVVVIDDAEVELASARFGNDRDGYRLMCAFVRRWSDRTWAVEGAGGADKHVAQRLVSDGETGRAIVNRGRFFHPARPVQPRRPALRISHSPHPSLRLRQLRRRPEKKWRLDTEGTHSLRHAWERTVHVDL